MATTDRIADEDGLTNADFAYQWVRRDLATNAEADIEGATSSTYTVTDADEAICANGANGDKKLSNRLERTVSGPGG